jgi:hypothetical protein
MSMRQYLVGGSTDDGDNLDMVITAESAAEALRLWLDYWAGEGRTAERIHELPSVGEQAGVHEWAPNLLPDD